jgi:hypothetical protein
MPPNLSPRSPVIRLGPNEGTPPPMALKVLGRLSRMPLSYAVLARFIRAELSFYEVQKIPRHNLGLKWYLMKPIILLSFETDPFLREED